MYSNYMYNDSYMIASALNYIRKEMDRLYWNKYQKEMVSPFDNTGEVYSNDTFSVRAYDWDSNEIPNFEYKDLRVYWYKHSNRGLYACSEHQLTFNDVENMIEECCKSLQRDFEKKGE